MQMILAVVSLTGTSQLNKPLPDLRARNPLISCREAVDFRFIIGFRNPGERGRNRVSADSTRSYCPEGNKKHLLYESGEIRRVAV